MVSHSLEGCGSAIRNRRCGTSRTPPGKGSPRKDGFLRLKWNVMQLKNVCFVMQLGFSHPEVALEKHSLGETPKECFSMSSPLLEG